MDIATKPRQSRPGRRTRTALDLVVNSFLIGSPADKQKVLDVCAGHGIGQDIQVIPIQEVDDAYKHVETGDVRFCYVIDMVFPKQEVAAA